MGRRDGRTVAKLNAPLWWRGYNNGMLLHRCLNETLIRKYFEDINKLQNMDTQQSSICRKI